MGGLHATGAALRVLGGQHWPFNQFPILTSIFADYLINSVLTYIYLGIAVAARCFVG